MLSNDAAPLVCCCISFFLFLFLSCFINFFCCLFSLLILLLLFFLIIIIPRWSAAPLENLRKLLPLSSQFPVAGQKKRTTMNAVAARNQTTSGRDQVRAEGRAEGSVDKMVTWMGSAASVIWATSSTATSSAGATATSSAGFTSSTAAGAAAAGSALVSTSWSGGGRGGGRKTITR